MEFEHAGSVRHPARHACVDQPSKSGRFDCPKAPGGKNTLAPPSSSTDGVRSSPAMPGRPQDGVGARGIPVPPEAVESRAERVLDRTAPAASSDRGRLVVRDQDDLRAAGARVRRRSARSAAARDAARSAYGTTPVRRAAVLSPPRHLVHQRMVDEASRDVDDAMRALLEDADLGRCRAPADREAGAMAVPERTRPPRRPGEAGPLPRGACRAPRARRPGMPVSPNRGQPGQGGR